MILPMKNLCLAQEFLCQIRGNGSVQYKLDWKVWVVHLWIRLAAAFLFRDNFHKNWFVSPVLCVPALSLQNNRRCFLLRWSLLTRYVFASHCMKLEQMQVSFFSSVKKSFMGPLGACLYHCKKLSSKTWTAFYYFSKNYCNAKSLNGCVLI